MKTQIAAYMKTCELLINKSNIGTDSRHQQKHTQSPSKSIVQRAALCYNQFYKRAFLQNMRRNSQWPGRRRKTSSQPYPCCLSSFLRTLSGSSAKAASILRCFPTSAAFYISVYTLHEDFPSASVLSKNRSEDILSGYLSC